tara:strand:+ start:378 stop:803 length:426 start_codon:yes stop_codon:yes gene_type:complete
MIYETIFNIYNTGILIFWSIIIIFPKRLITQKLIEYPWVPLGIAFGYIYFLTITENTFSVDFSSLSSITDMFKNSNPKGVAAGWLHYLAFDFWVGCWILKDSQKKGVKHTLIIFPMLTTFILGPVGIIIYTLILLINKKLI